VGAGPPGDGPRVLHTPLKFPIDEGGRHGREAVESGGPVQRFSPPGKGFARESRM